MTLARVLLTRRHGEEAELRQKLQADGVEVLNWPGIELRPVSLMGGHESLGQALKRASAVVFPSPGAVACAWEQWPDLSQLLISLGLPVYGQGPGTMAQLIDWGLPDVRKPDRANAMGLADLISTDLGAGDHVVMLCGNLSLDVLPARLGQVGIAVEKLVIYENGAPMGLARQPEPLHCAVYASPSAARNHLAVNPWLRQVPAVAYGPTTGQWLREDGGMNLVQVAKTPSCHSLMEAVNLVLKGQET